jgi:hypothetical protein
MAALTLLLFYLKVSYAAMAGIFLLGLSAFRHSRRAAVIALIISAAGALAVELIWSETANYLGDIRIAGAASGSLRGGPLGLVATVINNLTACYLFASILLLAYLSRARLDYLLMSLFMGAAGLVLANQNYQGPGILTFIPAALVAILAPRSDREAAGEGFNLANILLAGALMVPPAVAGLGNLAFHFFAASTPPGANPSEVRLDGLITQDAPPSSKASSAASQPEPQQHCEPPSPVP